MRLFIGIMTKKEEKQATEINSFKAYHDNKYKKKGNRMSYFPFFKEIEGEKCLVIGGGKVAARKISRLKGFGVKIKVVAPSIVSDRRKDAGSQKDPSQYGNAFQGLHLLHCRKPELQS